jgi:hypothetical protein
MREWRERSGEKRTPREFNEGACTDIVEFVADMVQGVRVVRLVDLMFPEMSFDERNDFEDENSSIIHEFIKYGGKYYDAEVPCGVESIEELPVLKRFRESKRK